MAEDVVLIQVGKRGALTLPKTLRDKYGIRPGDALTLLDLGGTFVLIPKVSMVDRLADRIAQGLREQGPLPIAWGCKSPCSKPKCAKAHSQSRPELKAQG